MSTPADEKKITLTLTDRAPVAVLASEWPVIASGEYSHECGQYAQNGRQAWTVRVRRHADGRQIVYGRQSGACQCDGDGGPASGAQGLDGGALLAAGASMALLVAAIRAAAERLRPSNARAIAAQCVADLPADEI